MRNKERVKSHGEVFTPENIVNDMLDLVKEDSENIYSTFLEPTCGNGNFIIEILRRKLNSCVNSSNIDRDVIISVSSIYGIDILEDNVEETRERMMAIVENYYHNIFKIKLTDRTKNIIEFLIKSNIQVGDMLVGINPYNKVKTIISSWIFEGDYVERKDYSLQSMLNSLTITKARITYVKDLYYNINCLVENKL